MRQIAILAAGLVLVATASSPAVAQKLDKHGRCHAANGQFARAEVCGRGITSSRRPADVGPAAVTAPSRAPIPATPQRCKNDKGRYAKCGSPGAHPA